MWIYLADNVTLYTRKKRGGHLTPRTLPLTKRLKAILTRRYTSRKDNVEWVFWHRPNRGKRKGQPAPYKYRRGLMKSLCKRAEVKPFTFHAFRHAMASLLEQENVPVGTIQELLGHENRTTTEIYLQTVGNAKREAVDVLEGVWQKSHQSPTEGGELDGLDPASSWIN